MWFELLHSTVGTDIGAHVADVQSCRHTLPSAWQERSLIVIDTTSIEYVISAFISQIVTC